MKTIMQLFRKSIGWPLCFWLVIFLLWHMLETYCLYEPIKEAENLKYYVLVGLDLLGWVLKIWFLGYFFCIAIRTSKGEQFPLYPLGLKKSFVMGVHTICRFIFICLPLIIIFWVTLLRGGEDADNFFNAFLLVYTVLVFIPFCVFFVADAEELPYFLGWTFFKKKLDFCLLFLLLSSLSYHIWIIFAQWLYSFVRNFSVLSWKEASLLLLGYLSLFYLMSFNAVLLGLIAKKAKIVSVEPEVAPVAPKAVDEKEAPVVQKKQSTKQPVKKTSAEKVKTAKKVAAKKVKTKKSVATKKVKTKVTRKKGKTVKK